MKYKIIHKDPFKIAGYKKDFTADQAFNEIPKFFNETIAKINQAHISGQGIYCASVNDEEDFNLIHYYIGTFSNHYQENPQTYSFSKSTWVIFPCYGPYPYALQKLNYEIYRDWFNEHPGYQLAYDASIEFLSNGNRKDENYYSELWLPIVKKDA